MLEKEFKRHNLKFGNYVKSEEIKKVFTECSVNHLDDLISHVGYGQISAKRVVNYFLAEECTKCSRTGNRERSRRKRLASPSLGYLLLTLTI